MYYEKQAISNKKAIDKKNKQQKAFSNPHILLFKNPMQLQSIIGNQGVVRIMKRTAGTVQLKSDTFKVIQCGGNKWVPHDSRELVEDRGAKGGYGHVYLTKAINDYYVEAWINEKGKLVYAGDVTMVFTDNNSITLHTRSDEGKAGGLSGLMFIEALRIIKEKYPDTSEVRMTPAPGAASKKVIEMLSEMFGDRTLHEQATTERNKRKALEERKESVRDPELGLNKWDPRVLTEHQLHLEALAASKVKGLDIMSGAGYILGGGESGLIEVPAAKIKRIVDRSESGLGEEGGYGIIVKKELLKRI